MNISLTIKLPVTSVQMHVKIHEAMLAGFWLII